MNTFRHWYEHMGYHRYRGQYKCANALGVTTATVRNYLMAKKEPTRTVRLAMTAITMELKPWGENYDMIVSPETDTTREAAMKT